MPQPRPMRVEQPLPGGPLGCPPVGQTAKAPSLRASPRTEAPAPPRASDEVRAFVDALLSPDESRALALVEDLLEGGLSIDQLYVHFFPDAARYVGELWAWDSWSFFDVTVASGQLHRLVHRLRPRFLGARPCAPYTGRIWIGCLPGRDHAFGLQLVAEFLERDGWSVHVGPPFGRRPGAGVVGAARFDMAGLSVSCDDELGQVRREIRGIREASLNASIRVLVGGRVFDGRPKLVEQVGADGYAEDARDAVRVAAALL